MPIDLPFLFEDNHVLAVCKPFGMLSQGDLTGDLDVLTVAKQIIKTRDQKPGNVFLGLVHRLDRPVGGAMLVAKTSKAAARLSAQFRERSTEKIYWAVVTGCPAAPEAELCHRLQKDSATRVTRVVASGGKEARLRYRVLETAEDRSLLEVRLITGLSHQIRAQLCTIGHSIVGDRKYGATLSYVQGAVALFSKSIRFDHPTKKMPVTVEATIPSNWPFPS